MTKIEEIRRANKMTRQRLSEEAHVSKVTIWKIERHGYKKYNLGTIEKIAKALGVPEYVLR